jgi:LmbE family N-acetylglucosaminyl deacetylase
MKPLATTLAALCLATGLSAQSTLAAQTKFTDPANLGGERVKPRDGRELPIDQGTTGLQQLLRRLSTRASIMNIVAHPDDEDGGMMTLYSRGMGARVADLSLTRGEGGQNAMTGDFEDALGLLRTQELLACDRYSGVDQFFGTEVDFGFSKTKEEAFGKWTHERVLYDVVRAIRIYRPLVLTSTWVGGVTDGHGQHQVSGEIAQEAFVAAGDPKVFPELTAEGILPWQPLKIYARVPQQAITDKGLFDYATGQYTPARFQNYVTSEITTTEPSTDVVVHEGDTDSLLADETGKPRSYVQFARIGLSQQKSQVGPGGRMPPAGKFDVSYHRFGTMQPKDKQKSEEQSFFDGIDTSLEGLAAYIPGASIKITGQFQALDEEIKQVSNLNSREDQRASVPELLADMLNRIDGTILMLDSATLPAQGKADVLHELRIKRVEANDALVLALGLHATAHVSHPESLPPHSYDLVPITVTTSITAKEPVDYLTPSEEPIAIDASLRKAKGVSITPGSPVVQDIAVSRHGDYDRPYFSRPNIEQPYYDLTGPPAPLAMRNAPVSAPLLPVHVYVRYRSAILVLAAPAPAKDVVPPASVALSLHAHLLPDGQKKLPLQVHVHTQSNNAKDIVLRLSLPSHWTAEPSVIHLKPVAGEMSSDFDRVVTVTPEPRFSAANNAKPAVIKATVAVTSATDEESVYEENFRAVGYGDLPRTNYFRPAETRIVPVDLKLPAALKIGYLPGTGDAVPEALESIGLKPERLTVADLTAEKLKQYDSVVLGVRTYAAHPELHGAPTKALLEYAKAGGNVVVQYQTAEFTGDDAPYPLAVGRYASTVVDETAPVRLIEEPNDPAQRLLVVPNRIHPDDFNGWVEERGHGFLSSWDNHYSALTETHDPGQDPQRGGLITTQLGAGRWTYLAFAVYRQLPEAVPGAFRLFVNLLEK